MNFLGLHASLHEFAFCDLKMLYFRAYFSLNVYIYIMIWGLHDRLPKKILHFGEINKLYFKPFFNLNLYVIGRPRLYDFRSLHANLPEKTLHLVS